MRDRLLSNYTVKPALARLKRTLLGLGGALASSVLLLAAIPPQEVNGATYAEYRMRQSMMSAQTQSVRATAGSSSSPQQQQEVDADDYWDRVSKFEPWALNDDDGSTPGDDIDAARTLQRHMMTTTSLQ